MNFAVSVEDSSQWTADEFMLAGISVNAIGAGTFLQIDRAAGGETSLNPNVVVASKQLDVGDILYPVLWDGGTTGDHSFVGTAGYNTFSLHRIGGVM